MKLNDIKCKSAKPNDLPSKTPRKLADGEGLYLWVMPNGAKYWRIKYNFQKKPKELALGVYPEISLKQARDRKTEIRQLVLDGKDPSLERKKKQALAQTKSVNTFEAIAREWYGVNKSKWSERYAEGVMTRL